MVYHLWRHRSTLGSFPTHKHCVPQAHGRFRTHPAGPHPPAPRNSPACGPDPTGSERETSAIACGTRRLCVGWVLRAAGIRQRLTWNTRWISHTLPRQFAKGGSVTSIIEALDQYGNRPYLLTVGEDGPHTSHTRVALAGGGLTCPLSKSAAGKCAGATGGVVPVAGHRAGRLRHHHERHGAARGRWRRRAGCLHRSFRGRVPSAWSAPAGTWGQLHVGLPAHPAL